MKPVEEPSMWPTGLRLVSPSPSGCGSLRCGVSHTGSSSPFSSILCIFHVELQVLHIVLDDVDPSLSLSSSAPLSTYICLQDPFDTIALFSPLYVPIPSQPGLPYLVRDTRYSKDATDVVISFPVPQRKASSVTCI